MIQAGRNTIVALAILFMCLSLAPFGIAQTKPRPEWTGGGTGDDKISLSETLQLEQAVKLLNDVTVKQGKVIIDNSGVVKKIGVEVVNQPWRRALELICKKNELEFEEGANYIRIFNPLLKAAQGGKDVEVIDLSNREVIIEAIFFEADRNALREIGVNWSSIYSGDVKVQTNQDAASNVSDNNIFTLTFQRTVDKTLSISGIVKTFENKGQGTILANPQIRVRAGKQGYVQVGQDFSIKTRDFAGNTVDNFISAGTILQVSPLVIVDHDVTFIHLKIDVERSTGEVSALTTTINKSKASTSLLMLPGEESAIGGLYTTEKSNTRKGIPFLKDLPWWVLGIRYLAGYERVSFTDKELVILLKVDLEPDIMTRVKNARKTESLRDSRMHFEGRRDDIMRQSTDEK